MDRPSGRVYASAPPGPTLQALLLTLLVVPLAGCVVAIVLAWRTGIGAVEIGTLGVMYAITTAAVTVGFHRHIAHRAFRAAPAVRMILAIAASMAAQGPVIYWAANHRRHHSHADQPGDPHSPYVDGAAPGGGLRGLVHAHVGWLFAHEMTDCARYAPDLLRDPVLVTINRLYLVWVGLGLALPALAGALITGTPRGALAGFLWGGLVRTFVLQHATFSINSICHWFGRRSFATHDHSTNNVWLALITFGEAWHNNHHAFPRSARFGLRWWQVDIGATLIRALELVGLAWSVRRTPAGLGAIGPMEAPR